MQGQGSSILFEPHALASISIIHPLPPPFFRDDTMSQRPDSPEHVRATLRPDPLTFESTEIIASNDSTRPMRLDALATVAEKTGRVDNGNHYRGLSLETNIEDPCAGTDIVQEIPRGRSRNWTPGIPRGIDGLETVDSRCSSRTLSNSSTGRREHDKLPRKRSSESHSQSPSRRPIKVARP